MMRLALAALFLLAACAERSPEIAACDHAASHEIVFTGGAAPDLIEARTFGPACGAAVAVFTLRSDDGAPVWAWAAPLHAFGDAFAPRAEGGPTAEDVETFLNRWVAVEPRRTSSAPAWSEALATPHDRQLYEDVRARGVPMLCQLSAVAQETCFYWESGAAAAIEFYRAEVGAAP